MSKAQFKKAERAIRNLTDVGELQSLRQLIDSRLNGQAPTRDMTNEWPLNPPVIHPSGARITWNDASRTERRKADKLAKQVGYQNGRYHAAYMAHIHDLFAQYHKQTLQNAYGDAYDQWRHGDTLWSYLIAELNFLLGLVQRTPQLWHYDRNTRKREYTLFPTDASALIGAFTELYFAADETNNPDIIESVAGFMPWVSGTIDGIRLLRKGQQGDDGAKLRELANNWRYDLDTAKEWRESHLKRGPKGHQLSAGAAMTDITVDVFTRYYRPGEISQEDAYFDMVADLTAEGREWNDIQEPIAAKWIKKNKGYDGLEAMKKLWQRKKPA